MLENNPTAVIIAIGDELLLGEIENSNTTFFCRQLGQSGVEVKQCLVIPDDLNVISTQVAVSSSAADYVIVSGGIGPTPDDLTRQSIAKTCGVSLDLSQAAAAEYERRHGKPLNPVQLDMCRLPTGCELIWSGYPSPPAFRINNIYVFPGVPEIMMSAWETVSDRFKARKLFTESFVTNRGESHWAGIMQEYMDKYPDLKIGSYPQMDQQWRVEIRIRGADQDRIRLAATELEQAIKDC